MHVLQNLKVECCLSESNSKQKLSATAGSNSKHGKAFKIVQ
jgi:hypothetical protein